MNGLVHTNNIDDNNLVFGAAGLVGEVGKARFQQPASTHSVGEKHPQLVVDIYISDIVKATSENTAEDVD